MVKGLLGFGKREPVLTVAIAGVLTQLLVKYGIEVSNDDLIALVNVITVVAGAIYARSKVSPVEKPELKTVPAEQPEE